MTPPTLPPLAITGIGTISPLGLDADAFFSAWLEGRSGLSEVDAAALPAARGWAGTAGWAGPAGWAGRVNGFVPSAYLPAMRARRLDRSSLFAVAAAQGALAGAGLTGRPEITDGLAVVMGTGSAGSGPLTVFLEALFRQSPEAAPPFEFPNTVANAPASHVSIELGLRAHNLTLAQGESVMGLALLNAQLLLAEERSSAVLVGAVDEWNPYYQLGYAQLGALRLAAGADGIVLSEGSTQVVVEGEAAAAARGAFALAVVRGVAVGGAVGPPFRWVADAEALARVVTAALASAGIEAAEVGSVMLAANGVAAMERAEADALLEVLGERSVAVSGLKGLVGERAVSGALSVAGAALARSRGVLPPFGGTALEAWPSSLTPLREPIPFPEGATLVMLQGFGGNYAAAVLR